MSIAAVVISSVLAGLLVLSASIKLTRREPYVQGYLRVGVPEDKLNYLAAILLAGAAGLILGLLWEPIGIVAAAALVCYFLVAIASHVRADDLRNLPNPLAMVLLAVAALVLQLATL